MPPRLPLPQSVDSGAAFAEESDPEDGDYVPPPPPPPSGARNDGGSDSDASSLGDSDASSAPRKRRRKQAGTQPDASLLKDEKQDSEAAKKHRDALWATFQASILTTTTSMTSSTLSPSTPATDATLRPQIDDAPAPSNDGDSPNAVEGPTKAQSHGGVAQADTSSPQPATIAQEATSVAPAPAATTVAATTALTPPKLQTPTPTLSVSAPTPTLVSSTSATTTAPRATKPRRKPLLLPSAGKKERKLSTLDASAQAWAAATETEADALAAHRRSGAGLLDRAAFLHRVDERKEAMRAEIGAKRRR